MVKSKQWKIAALTIASVLVGCGTISVPGRNRPQRGPEPVAVSSSGGGKAATAAPGSRVKVDSSLSRETQNRLRAIQRIQKKCPLDKRPFTESDALNHQAGRLIGRCASKRMADFADKIPEHERSHPDVAPAIAYVEKLVRKDAEWRAEAKQIREEKKSERKYGRAVRDLEKRHMRRLGRLKKMDAGKRNFRYDVRAMEAEVRNMPKIERMVRECDAKFPNAKIKSCELARNWKKVYKSYLPEWAKKRVERRAHRTKSVIKVLGNTGVLYGHDLKQLRGSKKWFAEMRAEFKKIFSYLDMELPEEIFEPVKSLIPDFKVALKKAAKINRWPKKSRHKDRSIRAAAVRAFRSEGLKVRRVGMEFPDWTIKKTPRGIPLYRFRNVTVMAKGKGESFCRVYDGLSAKGQYKGGGRYTRPMIKLTGGERFLVSSCR